MRLMVDSLIALMLVAVLAGIILYYRHDQQTAIEQQRVHLALAKLQEATMLQGAMGEVETNGAGFPLDVSPLWFGGGLPTNPIVPGRQPWLDVAPSGDFSDHPPDPVIHNIGQAGFWYNPNRGLFRARVTPQFTEEDTLALYNKLNGSNLRTLPHGSARRGAALRPAGTAHVAAEAPIEPAAPSPRTLRDLAPQVSMPVPP